MHIWNCDLKDEAVEDDLIVLTHCSGEINVDCIELYIINGEDSDMLYITGVAEKVTIVNPIEGHAICDIIVDEDSVYYNSNDIKLIHIINCKENIISIYASCSLIVENCNDAECLSNKTILAL